MKLKFFRKNKTVAILIVGLIVFFIVGIFKYNEIILYLLSIDTTGSFFLILYIFVCFFYFLSPLPITFVILINGFMFKELGALLSLLLVIICSYIIFSFSELISNKFNLKIDKFLKFKKINLMNFSKNISAIFISRYVVPYFFHNLYYGLVNIRPKTFILTIFFAEMPMIYCLNSIGGAFKNFSYDQNYSIIDLLLNKNFNIPLLVIISIFFSIKYINTKR